MFELNSLLVPIDFSPASRAAFQRALEMTTGERPLLLLLHALDPGLIQFGVAHGLGSHDQVVAKMRERADAEMADLRRQASEQAAQVEIETIVSEGVPFLEIIRKADDFQVDAIVMGKFGARGRAETLLFGSTAERVLRGTSRVVIVLPVTET